VAAVCFFPLFFVFPLLAVIAVFLLLACVFSCCSVGFCSECCRINVFLLLAVIACFSAVGFCLCPLVLVCSFGMLSLCTTGGGFVPLPFAHIL
jgi:hypothetical protein